jgi:proteasome beta subunit
MSHRRFIPGATTLGLVCSDGVILASEKRVSYGNLILSRSGKKVFKINERIGAACAGLVSDMQILIKSIAAYSSLFELESKMPVRVQAVAKITSNLLFNSRYFPIITQTIVAGIDEEGSKLYVLDMLGSNIPDKYSVVGSGAELAIGILEEGYKEDINLKDGRELAIKAIKSAISRDAISGDGIDLLLISKEGIKEETMKF